MSQADVHLAAEAEEDRLLAERADAEVCAIHEQQQLESQEREFLLNINDTDDAAALQQQQQHQHNTSDTKDTDVPVNPAATSYVTAGLSFAVDCLGDEWAPADETQQQRQERHLKRAGIIKIMELDNRLCAVRQRHRMITRTLASANGTAASPSRHGSSRGSSSTLFSDKDRRLHQRLQRAADMCKNIEAPQLVRCALVPHLLSFNCRMQVSALQAEEEQRVSAILSDESVPRFGYDEAQQHKLHDIDRKLLKIAAPDVADELIASFGINSVSAPITSTFSGAKARADAEASRFLQFEQQRRQEQARIKDVNAQLRNIMELERLTVEAHAPPPDLPPGCRLVPKSRDQSASLVVVAAPSAIQVCRLTCPFASSALTLLTHRSFCSTSGVLRAWAILPPGRLHATCEARRGQAVHVPSCRRQPLVRLSVLSHVFLLNVCCRVGCASCKQMQQRSQSLRPSP
jgi:hypothetical protein